MSTQCIDRPTLSGSFIRSLHRILPYDAVCTLTLLPTIPSCFLNSCPLVGLKLRLAGMHRNKEANSMQVHHLPQKQHGTTTKESFQDDCPFQVWFDRVPCLYIYIYIFFFGGGGRRGGGCKIASGHLRHLLP